MIMKRYLYRVNGIKLDPGDDIDVIPRLIEKKTGIRPGSLDSRVPVQEDMVPGSYMIRRESIDARDKRNIKLVYTVDIEVEGAIDAKRCRLDVSGIDPVPAREHPVVTGMEKRPVVIGCGPCGLFAALELAMSGSRPVVVERGSRMEKRVEDVDKFRANGVLDPESNVLFGEGGAGTFSDGKLASGIKDDNVRYVLKVLWRAGAGDDILYRARPHIGTDVLTDVIVNIRKRIEELGGEVLFDTRLKSFDIHDGALTSVTLEGPNGESVLETDDMVLAIGHSARDTFQMLHEHDLDMEQKPFSIGVRIEHPQRLIDAAQYGKDMADSGLLPPAEYKVSHRARSGRGVYSFCMCPGGEVIVCSTEYGELCVNGMSNRDRASGFANSGILCDVRTDDFDGDDVLAGVEFQRKYERLAYLNAITDDGAWKAPSCAMKEFLESDTSDDKNDVSENNDADRVIGSLPGFASDAIREAVPEFAKKIRGYDDETARVIAVETRSSSPVRIIRDSASGMSNLKGIYPAGEGAGYAGGITSAACDGIRAAGHIIDRYVK